MERRWQSWNEKYSPIPGQNRFPSLFDLQISDADTHAIDCRFKPTATLATTFETRRLPRAYVVLLESLLNVNPSARPTCERVLSAIREGRVCLKYDKT